MVPSAEIACLCWCILCSEGEGYQASWFRAPGAARLPGAGAPSGPGKVPPHAMVYFAMAMESYGEDDYEDIMARLTETLRGVGVLGEWEVANGAGSLWPNDAVPAPRSRPRSSWSTSSPRWQHGQLRLSSNPPPPRLRMPVETVHSRH